MWENFRISSFNFNYFELIYSQTKRIRLALPHAVCALLLVNWNSIFENDEIVIKCWWLTPTLSSYRCEYHECSRPFFKTICAPNSIWRIREFPQKVPSTLCEWRSSMWCNSARSYNTIQEGELDFHKENLCGTVLVQRRISLSMSTCYQPLEMN